MQVPVQAHTKLKALLDTALAAEDLGTITSVHDQHAVADMPPDACSVDIESFSNEPGGVHGTDGAMLQYEIDLSVRVHTGYEGDQNVGTYNADLLGTVEEYLQKNRDLGDNFRIYDIAGASTREAFDDSKTIGAQIIVTVTAQTWHTQS